MGILELADAASMIHVSSVSHHPHSVYLPKLRKTYLKNSFESRPLPTALLAARLATLLGFPLATLDTSFAARAALYMLLTIPPIGGPSC